MLERYTRALRLTGPKFAAETPGITVHGYWLDESHFYFQSERWNPSLGRIVSVPSIAACESQQVEEIASFEAVAEALSAESENPADARALCSAAFDMPDAETLALTVDGREYLLDVPGLKVKRAKPTLTTSTLYSPDGRLGCFVRGYDIWLINRETGTERPLTHSGVEHFCYGQAPETSLSALTYKTHPSPTGLWSPDSQWFLTHRIDERALPEMPLIQHVPKGGGRPVLHKYKYPLPGDPLPVLTYVAVHVVTGRIVEFFDFQAPLLTFSPFALRMAWFDAFGKVWFVRIDRHFKRVELITLDCESGGGKVVLEETVSSGYLDLSPVIFSTPNIRTLPRSKEIIWFSERDGWGHLYLYDAETGALKNRITAGEWLVRDIVHVDERHRRILFLAGGVVSGIDPAHRVLCSINFDGSNFRVLVQHDGDVFVSRTEPTGFEQNRPFAPACASPGVSPDCHYAVVRFSNVERGTTTEAVDLESGRRLTLCSAVSPPDAIQARRFTALAADGVTRLHGVMFLPAHFDVHGRYPLIDYIYPGPSAAHQPQSFHSVQAALAKSLAELGIVTIMLDTRGAPISSRAFHQVGYGSLLEPQLADHAAVVRQLCDRHGFLMHDRVGIVGWSGGGAAAARAICDYGGIFKICVAACGNHDSTFYTSMWSDKYRGTESRGSWSEQANSAAAHKLTGKMLLMCGDMDENVHVSQTWAMVDALIKANKDFDLLIVPNAGHDVLMTNGYAQRRVWDFVVANLLEETPPKEFEVCFEPHELGRFALRSWQEFGA